MSPEFTGLSAEQKRELLDRLLRARTARPEGVPLSQGQQRIWDFQALDPASPVYNICIAYDLDGPLDAGALARALDAVVARHESLRTTFEASGGRPVQVVGPGAGAGLEVVDLAALAEADGRTEAERVALADAARPFDLRAGPPRRFTLVRRSTRAHVLVVTIHHIICDRWSLGILARELGASYAGALGCGTGPSLDPPGSYADFVAWEREALGEEALVAALAAWEARLGHGLPALRLPDGGRPSAGYRGGREAFGLGEPLAEDLRALAAAEGVTLYVVLLAGLAALLRVETGQDDLVICSPVSGRHRPLSRGVIGYFNNVLPLRLDTSGGPDFRALVGRVARESKAAFDRQDVPFQRIAELPGLARTPLTRCLFSLQNTHSLALRLPGVAGSYRDVPTGAANFDLSLFCEEKPEGLIGLADYKADVFGADAVRRLTAGYREILREFSRDPGRRLPDGPAAGRPAATAPDPAVGAPGAPVNELERRLVRIWEETLGTRPVARTDDFFEIGGHSLPAARLVGRVEQMLDRELPLAMLLKAPTVAQLAALLADEGWASSWSSLVPVRPEGTRPAFYCVHGGGGGVISYRRLAQHLHPDQPVWGLQAQGRSRSQPPLTRVEDMAGHYLEAVRGQQPEGPYYLGGHSFGALVAFEMARQITAAGQAVALLAVIDYPGPAARVTWRDRLRWNLIVLSQLDGADKFRHVRSLVDWRVSTDPRVLGPVRALYLRLRRRGARTNTSRRLETFHGSLSAIEQYRVESYPGPLTLFRALRGSPAIHTDPQGGWGGTARRVDVVDVPGEHMTLFREPYIRALAEALQARLDQARGSP